MKDYLNTQEKENLVRLAHFASDLERAIEFNTFTSKEKGDLKRAFTYTEKTLKSVLTRLNISALKSYQRTAQTSRMTLDLYGDKAIEFKRKKAEYDAIYEENKEYYKLIELFFDINCRNCTKDGAKCEIYKEFENQCIYEFDGTDKCTNCKYSWNDKK